MRHIWKTNLLTIVLFASVLAVENCSINPAGNKVPSPQGETTVPPGEPVGAASIVVDSSPLRCEGECEIRFEDGECKTNIACKMEKLYPPGEDDRFGTFENKRQCGGKCLYKDQENNCRLDLICVLDEDVEGTLRFLMGFNIDHESAIHLALSASRKDNEGSSYKENPAKPPEVPPVIPLEPVKPPKAPCSCSRDKTAGSEGTSNLGPGALPQPGIIGTAPFNACPNRCEVRDFRGKCVVDLDCVNSAR